MVVPDITRIGRLVEEGARTVAPAEKQWKTVGDHLVRKWHRAANGQTVPSNLRFTLDTPEWEQQHEGYGPKEMGREPRDPVFSYVQRVHCRCFLGIVPDGVSKTIEAHPARAAGTTTTARVTCDHPLAEPAEFGNDEDHGARFMAAGLKFAAARLG
jgi:hypothetical protein